MVGSENKYYVGIEAVFLSPRATLEASNLVGLSYDFNDFHSEVFNKFFTKIFENKFNGD